MAPSSDFLKFKKTFYEIARKKWCGTSYFIRNKSQGTTDLKVLNCLQNLLDQDVIPIRLLCVRGYSHIGLYYLV